MSRFLLLPRPTSNVHLHIMKQIALLVSAVYVALLSGCYTTNDTTSKSPVVGYASRESALEESKWDLMVGTWYGKQPKKEGGIHEWLMTRKMDGSYHIQFRTTSAFGGVKYSEEVGTWGVSAEIYFTTFDGWIIEGVFVKTDLEGQFTRDAYRIEKLNQEEMIYTSLETESTYRVVRVTDSFKL